MNAINQNQSVGLLFESALLKYIKDLGYHTKTTQHTDLEYIADATLKDDGYSIYLEIKSHRFFPLETTKDTFKRICEVSIKNSKPNKPRGLFHQWRRGTSRCDHYFVFVGLYTKDADEHAQDVLNGDILNNYHHYSLYWTWKGQMFWLTIPALEMFALLAKHQGSFRAFISELCELTPDRYHDGICYHSSTKYEEYNVDPRQTGQDGNYNDIGSIFDLSDCIYNYEHYQTDPSWNTEKLNKHNISIDDDLPQLIDGIDLEKSDLQIIKENILLGKDLYETSIQINKSKSYLHNIFQGNATYNHPKFKSWRLWIHDLMVKSGQLPSTAIEIFASLQRRISELEKENNRLEEKKNQLENNLADLKFKQPHQATETKLSNEEDIEDALKMVNRYERIIDNLMNQLDRK